MMVYLDCGLRISGQIIFRLHILIIAGVLSLLENTNTNGLARGTEDFLHGLEQYEVVHPIRVDSSGRFLSNFVSYHVKRIQRRQASLDAGTLAQVFYHLQYGDQDFNFNLTLNPHLLAPGFLTERRYGGLQGSYLHGRAHAHCHFLGEVSSTAGTGPAAVSTCDGLTGLFKLSGEEFFIRPLEQNHGRASAQAHVIYKRHAAPATSQNLLQPLSREQTANGTCGVKDPAGGAIRVERQRERWEKRHRRRRIRQRSISREKWVETLVVADPKMVEYHGSKGVESYALAVMNIVAGLFHDASIGNSIHIVVVRLILLEQDEDDLKITHHADNTLNSFCKWQKQLNMQGDDHPVHHDVAVLLTRKDICANSNKPCETLGLSHVAGMCQPHRSCSVSEDTGLPIAFTVAHELGHNFGIQHDGNGNDCEPVGKRPFVMSPQLLYGTSPPNWSRCSRQYITRFLDRGWGWCLDDRPAQDELAQHSAPPGVLYSAAQQCQLQYGTNSVLCDDMDNVCSTLWCTVGTTCHSKLDGAVDGTKCGESKWCFDGECVAVGSRPQSVNGGWSSWTEWSDCSRTCGAGVQNAQRDCVDPVPRHGGKYCIGERRRYKICNTTPCPPDGPPFRSVQCSQFNSMPYKGKFYKWVQVINRVHPCQLHCRPLNEYFSEKMLDAVVDGTRCHEGSVSRSMCINGICKSVGCDYVIDSDAVEDRCGICRGNGSTCETVKKSFEESEGLGYVDIGLIPEGARDIRIEEVAEAGNFLALRSNDPEKYWLNGGWTIQWNGDYKAGGTVFTYERTGHLENLTSPGPTMEPVWIQLLFQETNPGVRYEYTISREGLFTSNNGTPVSDFQWRYGAWTECSATCGAGVQRQAVHCVERMVGLVEERYCDPATRPEDNRASCSQKLCPAIWWVGEWQQCSASCGDLGLVKRTVLCVQSVGLDEQRALQPSECQHLPRPEALAPCNTHLPCPADWTTGNWSECSITCAGGVRRREVICSWNTGVDCEPKDKPSSVLSCFERDCPTHGDGFGSDWSGSGHSSKEIFNEINQLPVGNHLPDFNTGPLPTRVPPGNDNDFNNLIYDDFSYHNRIDKPQDNSIKNNVQIDDFYYDYNFIKFHEDLSYDLDRDGNIPFDNSGSPKEVPWSSPTSNVNSDNKGTTSVTIATSTSPTPSSNILLSTKPSPHHNDSEDFSNDDGDSPIEKADEENSERVGLDISEDYFLPVHTTSKPPRGSVTKFSHSWTENIDHGSSQNLSIVPVVSQNVNVVSDPTASNEDHSKGTSRTPHTLAPDASETHSGVMKEAPAKPDDGYEETLMITEDVTETSVTSESDLSLPPEGQFEEEEVNFDEDVPGGESYLEDLSPNFEGTMPPPPFGTFETLENSFVSLGSHPSEQSKETSETPLVMTTGDHVQGERTTEEQGIYQYEATDLTLRAENGSSLLMDGEHAATLATLPQETSPSPNPAYSAKINRSMTSGAGPLTLPPTHTDSDTQQASFWSSTQVPAVTLRPEPSSWPGRQTAPVMTAGPSPPHSSRVLWRSPVPPATWTEIDYNEIIIPPSLRSRGQGHDTTERPAPDARSEPPTLSPTPAVPTQPAPSAPHSQAAPTGHWNAGNWSTCSTTCGLGAIWRSVTCSTGRDSDCEPAQKPVPARRCYLRPCAAWRVGQWSKCSRNCGGGVKQRDIHCHDLRDQRPLRPFHCQAAAPRPPGRLPCGVQLCLDWYTSSWGQCSELCGGGEQQRMVACPESGRCDESLQPGTIQTCNTQPCTQWMTGSWGQCSASCGGGMQQRLVKCVNIKSEQEEGEEEREEEEDRSLCDHEPWPENTQKCNLLECATGPFGQACLRDRLTFRFCKTLQWLGRCHLPTVRAQCCKTCRQGSRGNNHVAHH